MSVVKGVETNPTELELQILKVLWASQEWQQVREVRESLAELGRELAHTTVITTLNTMFDKKFVKRKKIKNAFVFTPRVSQETVSGNALGHVFERHFDQSAKALMLSLFEENEISAADLQDLKKILDEKLKEQKS